MVEDEEDEGFETEQSRRSAKTENFHFRRALAKNILMDLKGGSKRG